MLHPRKVFYLASVVFVAGVGAGWSLRSMYDQRDTDILALVGAASNGTAEMVRSFAGPGPFTGVIVKAKTPTAKSIITWETQGKLVVGHLYDPDGTDLTARAADEQHVLHPMDAIKDYSGLAPAAGPDARLTPEAVFARATTSSGSLVQGRGPRELVVFTSPSCAYCLRFKRMADQVEEQYGQHLTIRWLPVGFREADVVAATEQLGGGAAARQQILDNSALLEAVSQNPARPNVPLLMWKDDDGIKKKIGAPTLEGLKAIWEGAGGA